MRNIDSLHVSARLWPFNRQIAEPAVKLNLNQGYILVVKGSYTNLRMVTEMGVSYEIAITNMPPDDMASIDHWLFYYDFIGTKVTPHTLVEVKKTAFAPRPAWCSTAIFSRSKLN